LKQAEKGKEALMNSQAATVPGTDADGILRELTTRQHLTPHRPVRQVVAETAERVGACMVAADRALDRLQLDRGRSIGRLRRGELIQLARGMYRLWSRALQHETTSTSAAADAGAADGSHSVPA
jgi:hypothetical protein